MADLPVGVVYLLAASSLGVYGLVLGGWGSGSKYSLLGALRAAAQVVSYELILGVAIVSVVIVSGTLSLGGIVEAQARSVWYVLLQPVGFLLFLIAAVAETNRAPFDLPEAESELVAGYHTEYSGMRFAMYFIAEYVAMISMSAVAATLFFGGWTFPIPPGGPWWLFLKMLLLPLPVRLAACHPAPPPLRPVDAPLLERSAADRPAQRRRHGDHRRRDRLRHSHLGGGWRPFRRSNLTMFNDAIALLKGFWTTVQVHASGRPSRSSIPTSSGRRPTSTVAGTACTARRRPGALHRL